MFLRRLSLFLCTTVLLGSEVFVANAELVVALTPYRTKVIVLTSKTGAFTGVYLNAQAGIVATSASRIKGAGEIKASYFLARQTGENHYEVLVKPIGVAEVIAIHDKSDAAILKIPKWDKAESFEKSSVGLAAKTDAEVVAVMGPVCVDEIIDIDKWKVTSGEVTGKGLILASGAITANAAGGAVLNKENQLLGILAHSTSKTIGGYIVGLESFKELMDGKNKLAPKEQAAWLKATPGRVPYVNYVDLKLDGKFAKVARGVNVSLALRTIVLDAYIIRNSSTVLEYFACPLLNGKLHETVIATDCAPEAVRFALSALGYKNGEMKFLEDKTILNGDKLHFYLQWNPNEAVAIENYVRTIQPAWERPAWHGVREKIDEGVIKWRGNESTLTVRVEDLCFNRQTGRAMRDTHWIFNGSYIVDADKQDENAAEIDFEKEPSFAATNEGVLVAVYHDPAALANLPLFGAGDDMTYVTRDTVIPPKGTKCKLIIRPE